MSSAEYADLAALKLQIASADASIDNLSWVGTRLLDPQGHQGATRSRSLAGGEDALLLAMPAVGLVARVRPALTFVDPVRQAGATHARKLRRNTGNHRHRSSCPAILGGIDHPHWNS